MLDSFLKLTFIKWALYSFQKPRHMSGTDTCLLELLVLLFCFMNKVFWCLKYTSVNNRSAFSSFMMAYVNICKCMLVCWSFLFANVNICKCMSVCWSFLFANVNIWKCMSVYWNFLLANVNICKCMSVCWSFLFANVNICKCISVSW